jgi:hypothetical protein
MKILVLSVDPGYPLRAPLQVICRVPLVGTLDLRLVIVDMY